MTYVSSMPAGQAAQHDNAVTNQLTRRIPPSAPCETSFRTAQAGTMPLHGAVPWASNDPTGGKITFNHAGRPRTGSSHAIGHDNGNNDPAAAANGLHLSASGSKDMPTPHRRNWPPATHPGLRVADAVTLGTVQGRPPSSPSATKSSRTIPSRLPMGRIGQRCSRARQKYSPPQRWVRNDPRVPVPRVIQHRRSR